MSAPAAFMALFAGVAGSVQVAVMARLGERVGVFGALAFASLLQAILSGLLLLTVRQSLDGYAAVLRQPAWLWLGGVMGLIIVLSITFGGARIGTAATVGLLIAGQLAAGAVVDQYGLLGSAKIPIHWPRALGLVLLLAGAALSLRK